MSPQDPRHGTYAGASAHWKSGERPCEPCLAAGRRTRKRNRLAEAAGAPRTVPAIGTVRRLQALQALGWGIPHVARVAGISEKTLRNPTHRGASVHCRTAAAVTAAYDRLSMTIPEGPYAERGRRLAQRLGYAPPLAWDDDAIDDPTATPHGTRERARAVWANADLLAEWDHLRSLGVSLHDAARRLGVTPDGIEKAAQRARQRGAA